MGIVLLVVFNIFTLKSLAPMATNPSNSIALYNNERAIVPGRTILSNRDDSSYEQDEAPDTRTYPFLQCVAYINKTHSQR
jgi:hypothetical protein